MNSTKTALLRPAMALAALCIFAGTIIQAQEGSQANQAPHSVPGKITSMPVRGIAPPAAFTANPFAASLRKNHRAFAAAVPRDLAAELSSARFSVPAKSYSFPALALGHFLTPTTLQAKEFHDLGALGLNTSRLRSSKAPKMTGSQ